jgi:phage terminase large subunit-like protein
VALYADDQWIENLIERWQNRYGEKRVLVWRTNRWRQIAWAVRNFEQAVHGNRDLTHSGDDVLTRHIQNSRKRKVNVDDDRQVQMHTLAKPAQHSPLKVDGAMAAVLAWEARGDAIAHGVISTVEHKPIPEPGRPQQWVPDTALPAAALAVPGESGPFGSLS